MCQHVPFSCKNCWCSLPWHQFNGKELLRIRHVVSARCRFCIVLFFLRPLLSLPRSVDGTVLSCRTTLVQALAIARAAISTMLLVRSCSPVSGASLVLVASTGMTAPARVCGLASALSHREVCQTSSFLRSRSSLHPAAHHLQGRIGVCSS